VVIGDETAKKFKNKNEDKIKELYELIKNNEINIKIYDK